MTSKPVMVNEYLAGDNGVLILVTTVIGVVLVGRILRSGMNKKPQPGGTAPEVAPPTPAATAAPR